MTDFLLRLYHHLPARLRSCCASAWGLYLLRSRYGRETEALMAEVVEQEQWSGERWRAWQQERLGSLLQRAATRVPYYREQWAQRRRHGDQSSWNELSNWPVLEKEPLRRHGMSFIADDRRASRMHRDHTSGTTGKPLDYWWSPSALRAWYALHEVRTRRWYGVSRGDRWAMLGGQLVAPVRQQRPPFWVWNAAARQLYMSSYHLAPHLVPYYLDALSTYRVVYLLGYSSSLFALAQEVVRQGRRDLRMAVVVTNAEPLLEHQRETIAQAFQCPVRETYGMSEGVAAASECPAGKLHLWPSTGIVELLEGQRPAAPGAAGDVVATGLLNPDMPLIRYRVGDRAIMSADAAPCACGRSLPVLASIEGRSDDVLYTADGRPVGRLDTVFKANLPIREAQIIQESLDRVRIRYAPADGFQEADAHGLIQRLRDRMGQVQVVLEPVSQVPRTSNGKFRAVVCQLGPDVRDHLRQTSDALPRDATCSKV